MGRWAITVSGAGGKTKLDSAIGSKCAITETVFGFPRPEALLLLQQMLHVRCHILYITFRARLCDESLMISAFF